MRAHHRASLAFVWVLALCGCGSDAKLRVEDGTGPDPKLPPPEGVAVDSHGNIYLAAVQAKSVYKYVRH